MRTLVALEAPILVFSFLLTACGGRVINKNIAQELIVNLPQDNLNKDDVYIETLTQLGPKEAIVETRLRTAFRFEKVRGSWVIREVRLGHGQWEDVKNVARFLQKARTDETQKILDRVAEATETYQEKNGKLPAFKDYVALCDLLSPVYLTPLIRLDAWGHPLAAERLSPNTIRLTSAGSDGKFGSTDDIVLIKTFPQ